MVALCTGQHVFADTPMYAHLSQVAPRFWQDAPKEVVSKVDDSQL